MVNETIPIKELFGVLNVLLFDIVCNVRIVVQRLYMYKVLMMFFFRITPVRVIVFNLKTLITQMCLVFLLLRNVFQVAVSIFGIIVDVFTINVCDKTKREK